MAAPTRFASGVSTRAKTEPLGNYGLPDPTRWHTWFNDFDDYDATQWVITTTEAGASDATEAVSLGADNGILVLTNDAADNDNDFLQWAGVTGTSVAETWRITSGKQLYFKARFKLSDGNAGIAQVDAVIGLQITDTSPLAVTDGVYFLKTDASASLEFKTMLNSSATTSTAGTMVYDTYHTVAFYYDGDTQVQYWFDDVLIGTQATTTLVTDEDLTISFGVQNGQAYAGVMSVDYIFVAKER
jgi:hypothetical protein